MSTAWRKTIRDITIIILAGIVYYLIYRFTGWGLSCAFRNFTGLKCPSCGISHMFIHLFSLDFKSAFADNQFMFLTWPLVAAEIIYIIYIHESKRDLPKANVVAMGIYAGLLFIFGFFRIVMNF